MPHNRLANETSPYLLQHAENPVDWHPWGEEAIDKARAGDKPILLSIGYSACHWCHVMAHESFEDEGIAELMNELFVNVKVDREQRPDLDRIHQLAHQALTQRPGGWPLTVFLSPEDLTPFFAGTYFPKSPRHGLPGFDQVLKRVAQFYREHRDDWRKQNEALRDLLARLEKPATDSEIPDEAILDEALDALSSEFDDAHGGFGSAPKFPHPALPELLLRRTGEKRARTMLAKTLEGMHDGGLFDHLGGGFYRYCVDADWTIPHFEKMLYDNGPLAALYAEAGVMLDRDDFRDAAAAAADWVLRDMRAADGGFCASLDADSEGEEGKYYLWTPEETKALLTDDEWRVFEPAFGLDGPPNFEGRAWHLQRAFTDGALAKRLDLTTDQAAERLDAARQKLLEARAGRVAPGRDDKVLTSWNALMIRGLAVAGRLQQRDDWVDAAYGALSFIRDRLWQEGRLLASYRDGKAQFNAYLDDHAYLLAACLELLQARWDTGTLDFATAVADRLLDHFQDEDGGFYFTADDHERLIQRPMPFADESTPSGNGVAALALQRLGHLLAEPKYLDAAEGVLKAAAGALRQAPHAHATLLQALSEYQHPPQLVILRGEQEDLDDWKASLFQLHRPDRLVFGIPDHAADLPSPLDGYQAEGGLAAWICEGTKCSAPITDRARLLEISAQGV